MSTRTTYYNLTKPDADEHVLRTVINQNYDAIDLQMHANAEAAKEAAQISADEYDEAASYVKGDFCINQNTLYRANKDTSGPFTAADWDATTIAAAFEPKHTWELFETLTADGTDRFVYSSDLPENVTGIMINNTVQAGTAAFTLGIGFSLNGTTYPRTLGVASGINTGIRYSRASYIRDGNLWNSRITLAVTATPSNTTLQERLDTIDIGGDIKKIRIYAPSGEMMPTGSTFEIYIRR